MATPPGNDNNKFHLDVPMSNLEPLGDNHSARSSATNLYITLDAADEQQQQGTEQQQQYSQQGSHEYLPERQRASSLDLRRRSPSPSFTADAEHDAPPTPKVSIQAPDSPKKRARPRSAPSSDMIIEKAVERRRASGDWLRLSDRFYGPSAANLEAPRDKPKRHPSLRNQKSTQNFGFPIPPGAFSGLNAIDLAVSTSSAKRPQSAHRESHYTRPHPLERRLSAASASVVQRSADAASRRRGHRHSAIITDPDTDFDFNNVSLDDDDDDALSRDFVTAASVQAGEIDDDNTPGEVWLKNKARTNAVGLVFTNPSRSQGC